MILVAKQFIVEQRYRDGLFDVSLFRAAVLKIFLMEKCNAYAKGKMDKFRDRWKYFIDVSDALDM